MPQRAVQVHLVAIPPPLARAREVTSLLEVTHDPPDGPLGDPDSGCDFMQSNLRLLRDANQNVGVIAQERPVKVGRVPTFRRFIYHALTPAQTGDTNYRICGSYN